MDAYAALARETIHRYLTAGHVITPPPTLPSEMRRRRAGIFVSLHKKSDHSLRGCIGTSLPTKNCLAEEIIANAITASTEDPRFLPVTREELDDLAINVDVLSEPEPISDTHELDPKKYGLLVRNQRGHCGLLLPDIGVATVEEQMAVCCEKGGISPTSDKLSLYRFTVERHAE